nr:helix-turn-helix transcriptional regulator [uncultured Butyrivibrio sp.]
MRIIKDDIGFHNLLLSVRKHRRVSLEKLGYGLYSSTMMHYIESGERLPDYLMRNRIMDRLGVSAEDYSDYVSSEEYNRYKKRNELIEAVENEQPDIAMALLDFLLKSSDESQKIEYQFLLDMKARILMQQHCLFEEVSEIYKCAIDATMPGIDIKNLDEYYLSADEYFLITLWVWASFEAGKIALDIAEETLYSILKIIEKSFFPDITKCRIYPIVIVKIYNLYNNTKILDNKAKMNTILKYIDKAIELLRRNYRLYGAIELLEIKAKINWLDDRSKEWLTILKETYNNFGVNWNIDNNCYIYKNVFVVSVGEVIKGRREMLGITKKDLATDICTPKTVERIENGQNNPQQIVFKGLMQKLGVNGDYCRTDIQTNDFAMIQKYNEYLDALNKKSLYAIGLLNTIQDTIDYNSSNQQELARVINLMKLREGKISAGRFVANINKALMFTGIDINNIKELSGYLTNSELQCLYNIACRGSGAEEGKRAVNLMITLCEAVNKGKISNLKYSLYELIMSWYTNELGNEGQYAKSNDISARIIKESLKRSRASNIASELYNIAWNNAMQNRGYRKSKYISELIKIECIYEFCYRVDKVSFIRNKIDKFRVEYRLI